MKVHECWKLKKFRDSVDLERIKEAIDIQLSEMCPKSDVR